MSLGEYSADEVERIASEAEDFLAFMVATNVKEDDGFPLGALISSLPQEQLAVLLSAAIGILSMYFKEDRANGRA